MPLETLQATLHTDTVNGYFVDTSNPDHAAIDRMTTRLEDRLTANGYAVGTMVKYSSQQQANVTRTAASARRSRSSGLLVVAISMVGLINAVTMSVLERDA